MKKITVFLLALSTTFFISCESDDKVVDQVIDNYTVGAVLRTRNQEGSPYNAFVPGSEWTVTVEQQDEQFGGLLESVDLYISFTDNQDDPNDSSVPEQLLASFAASEFGTSERGLPELTFSTTLQESATAVGIGTGYSGGDVFSYRFVVNLTDGRSFTNTDANNGVLGGSYFSSPYQYDVVVACIPVGPVPGDFVLDMQDSFGDGWNGASIRVTLDGVATDYLVSAAQGTTNSETITVPPGTATWSWEYISGDFDSEVTYQLYAPNGKLAYADGPSPFVGDITESLSICP